MEGGRTSKVTHLQIRSNTTQGPGEWNLCYMNAKKRLGELCIYKGHYADMPPADQFGFIMDIAFSVDTPEEFGNFRMGNNRAFPGYGWGNLRNSGQYQVGNIKEWHYLPEDSAWYTKGVNIIKATLNDLMQIGRKWDRDIHQIASTVHLEPEGTGTTFTDKRFRMKGKPRPKKWWEKLGKTGKNKGN